MTTKKKESAEKTLKTKEICEVKDGSSLKAKKKVRDSGIELLRIVAILLIILHHFSIYTFWDGNKNAYTGHEYIVDIMSAFGKTGVAVFFLITGFFLQKQSSVKNVWKKVFSIVRPVWFYSIILLALFLFLGIEKLELSGLPMNKKIAAAFFPIISNSPWWFAIDYVALMVLSPYLKKMLDALTNKELFKLIVSCYVLIFGASLFNLLVTNKAGELISLSACFMIAATGYLLSRVEATKVFKKNRKRILIIGLIALFIVFVAPIFANFMRESGWTSIKAKFFWSASSPIALLLALSLFVIFKNLDVRSRIINYIASLTFGIYLIHDYPFMRNLLWETILGSSSRAMFKQQGVVFLAYVIMVVLLVFFSCGLIEAFRKGVVSFVMWIASKYKTASSKK